MNSFIKQYIGFVLIAFSILACAISPFATSTPSPTNTPAPTPTPTRLRPQAGVDSDGDWVTDPDETQFGGSDSTWDADGDGTTDFLEIFVIGSDPSVNEGNSDEDCCRDITEQKLLGTDPNTFDEDRDGDGIPDTVELKMGSDPGKADTDGDLLSDFLEIFLTETDPALADPLTASGYPQPLLEWMPTSLQNSACRFQIGATIDELYIADPEEADGPNDIVVGDELIMYYGLWSDIPPANRDNTLSYIWRNNSLHSQMVQGTAFKDDRFTDFTPVAPVTASCGEVVTLAIQLLESDAPWGGDRDFGTYLEHIPLLVDNIPPAWDFTYSASMFFEGTGGDSATSRYEIDYSFTAEAIE
ncbi:MAG: hypothetical protein KA314_07810 [Chloroflexi bacterium]|nr:hypothetical protein [Chloroflexota bacterium]MBP8055734.1 hypothetical protein [Chloroflexota bacterium]